MHKGEQCGPSGVHRCIAQGVSAMQQQKHMSVQVQPTFGTQVRQLRWRLRQLQVQETPGLPSAQAMRKPALLC